MATAEHQTQSDPIGRVHPRSVSITVMLNVLGMGAGYLYLGRPLRFAMLAGWTLATLAISFHGLWGAIATPVGFMALVSAQGFALLVAFIDSAIIARRSRDYSLRSYNRGWIYAVPVAVWIGFSMLKSVPVLGLERAVQTFAIPSSSMRPTLEIGDHIVGDMTAYRRDEPRRGDIAILRHRDGTSRIVRIIGLPGERIAIRDGSPVIDGVPVAFTDRPSPDGGTIRREVMPEGAIIDVVLYTRWNQLRSTPEVLLISGSYFVLGDNRDNSVDSRLPTDLGGLATVNRSDIIGRASFVWWSADKTRAGARLGPPRP